MRRRTTTALTLSSPSTTAVFVAKSTRARSTPGSLSKAACTRAAQRSHSNRPASVSITRVPMTMDHVL